MLLYNADDRCVSKMIIKYACQRRYFNFLRHFYTIEVISSLQIKCFRNSSTDEQPLQHSDNSFRLSFEIFLWSVAVKSVFENAFPNGTFFRLEKDDENVLPFSETLSISDPLLIE